MMNLRDAMEREIVAQALLGASTATKYASESGVGLADIYSLADACKQASMEFDPNDPYEAAMAREMALFHKQADTMIPQPLGPTAPALGKGPGTMPVVGAPTERQAQNVTPAGGKPLIPAAPVSAKGTMPVVGSPVAQQTQVVNPAGANNPITSGTSAPATGQKGSVFDQAKSSVQKAVDWLRGKKQADGGPPAASSGAAPIVPTGVGGAIPASSDPRADLVRRVNSGSLSEMSGISPDEIRRIRLREGGALFPMAAAQTQRDMMVPAGFFQHTGPIAEKAAGVGTALLGGGVGAVSGALGGGIGGAVAGGVGGLGRGVYDRMAGNEDAPGILAQGAAGAGRGARLGVRGGAILGGMTGAGMGLIGDMGHPMMDPLIRAYSLGNSMLTAGELAAGADLLPRAEKAAGLSGALMGGASGALTGGALGAGFGGLAGGLGGAHRAIYDAGADPSGDGALRNFANEIVSGTGRGMIHGARSGAVLGGLAGGALGGMGGVSLVDPSILAGGAAMLGSAPVATGYLAGARMIPGTNKPVSMPEAPAGVPAGVPAGDAGVPPIVAKAAADGVAAAVDRLKDKLGDHEKKETPADEKKESKTVQRLEAALGTEAHKPDGTKKDEKKDEKKDAKGGAKEAANILAALQRGR